MKVIYLHHAERNFDNSISNKEQTLTEDGIEECKLLAKRFTKIKQNVKAIYSSTSKRCKTTAELINKNLQAPIFDEPRFNEFFESENKKDFLNRNINALKEIIEKYVNDDMVICVTSGVNITAFICYEFNIEPTETISFIQAIACNPTVFTF